MRAGLTLEALAADHDVHLLVVPVVATPFADQARAWASRWFVRAVVHRPAPGPGPRTGPGGGLPLLARHADPAAVRGAALLFRDVAFARVHVVRLYLAPFAVPYLVPGGPPCHLDLDDHDCRTHRRLAALYAAAGRTAEAEAAGAEAERYAAMEAAWVPRFGRATLASEPDRRDAQASHGFTNLGVLPNGVRPPAAGPAPPAGGPFTFLFLGTLGYFPNEDGILHFCRDVLPGLRARAPAPFRVMVAGATPGTLVRALAACPEVEMAGPVPDVEPLYARSDAVVVPLRAGGGTRIKVLEAFASGRPVVSTALGVEGLDVIDGRHLLVADGADDLAAACARLMASAELRRDLAARARAFVLEHHGLGVVAAALRRP
jgi:glycosyltransferase involved in cell wall biosynthesis